MSEIIVWVEIEKENYFSVSQIIICKLHFTKHTMGSSLRAWDWKAKLTITNLFGIGVVTYALFFFPI